MTLEKGCSPFQICDCYVHSVEFIYNNPHNLTVYVCDECFDIIDIFNMENGSYYCI